MNSRTSFLSKLTQFQSRAVSVVPYAPERLSISQEGLTPAMAGAIAHAGMQAETRASEAPAAPEDDPRPANTLFAALRVRRALRRPKTSLTLNQGDINEIQANMDRHKKVLARYKIRRVDFIDPEAVQLKNLGWFMVNPHSNVFRIWQLMTLFLIVYQSLILPYGLAFSTSDNNTTDLFISCVFALDIIIQFSTPIAPTADETKYITNRKLIALSYARGWLFFDVLACLPFDQILLLINNVEGTGTGNLNILGLLKAMRAPRLLRLVRLLRVAKLFKIRPELRRWLQYSRHANLVRLVRLVLIFLVINHFVACIWYGAVASEELKSQDSNKDPFHQYIASFYLSILVVMGQNITIYDDTEYIFCILVMVLGAVLMAVVFGNVAILIANYYENQSSHQKKMEWLFASMNRMKLPIELQNRINDYYQAMWERHGTLDGAVTAFIPELSRNLAYEVELFLRMDMINRAPIFQSCSAKVVQELVMELELQVFMPGDYVVVRGEVGNDMYFVQNGVCEVTKDIVLQSGRSLSSISVDPSAPPSNEVVLKVLGQGDYFGEIALLMNCKRTANVRAQVFSELCTLTREVFENISQRYLEDRTIIEKFIMDKYDPGMLQAAMKQSQEVGMRAGGMPSRASPLEAQESTSTTEVKTLEMLKKIDERIQRLERRIEAEARERRDSEVRFQMEFGSSRGASSPRSASIEAHSVQEYVLFEPERVSQRNLLAPQPRPRGPSDAVPPDVQIIDGVATPDSTDEMKVWKRPTLSRPGSWRNARREGSLESLRLRGLVKPAGMANRHSSRSSSINAAIMSDMISTHHSQLQDEPVPRSSVGSRQVEDEIDRFGPLSRFEPIPPSNKEQMRKLSQIPQRQEEDHDEVASGT
ncbi:hypothetical protein PybrP1_003392 [[Pythium] brassicae (nom. inval.)]|nr:hypothetical protein PybrP1_003392 [[Pythium] brassicae (nom. inval.)]